MNGPTGLLINTRHFTSERGKRSCSEDEAVVVVVVAVTAVVVSVRLHPALARGCPCNGGRHATEGGGGGGGETAKAAANKQDLRGEKNLSEPRAATSYNQFPVRAATFLNRAEREDDSEKVELAAILPL